MRVPLSTNCSVVFGAGAAQIEIVKDAQNRGVRRKSVVISADPSNNTNIIINPGPFQDSGAAKFLWGIPLQAGETYIEDGDDIYQGAWYAISQTVTGFITIIEEV